MEYANFFQRVVKLGTSQKLPDRTFIKEVHVPKNEKETQLGTVILYLEVLSPWFEVANIGKTIFDTLVENYYDLNQTYENNQERLESSLKKVNKKLATVAAEGDVEWLGNLNGVCAVIFQNHLLLSQTGNADAYLFRKKSFSFITEGLHKKETPHPLKTFSNLTYGELQFGDKLLLTNNEIFESVPFQDIRTLLAENKTYEAGQKIKKILNKKRNFKANNILIGLAKTQDNSKTDVKNINIDEQKGGWFSKTSKYIRPIVAEPNGTKTEKEIAEKIDKDKKSFAKNFFIQIGTIALKIGNRFNSNFRKKTRRELVKEKLNNGQIDTHLYSDSPKKTAKPSKGNPILNFLKFIFGGLLALILGIFKPERRRLALILGVFILAIALILGISAFRKMAERKDVAAQAENLLVESAAKIKAGDEQLTLNQEEKAKKFYLDAISLATQAQENASLVERANVLISSAQQKIDQIDNIIRVPQATSIANFGSQNSKEPFGFCYIENDFYTINPITGQLNVFNSNTKEISTLGNLKTVENPKFSFCSDENIFVYTNSKYLYKYDIDGKATRLDSGTSTEWPESAAGNYFFGNIYLLDNTAGQIWKFRPEGENFSAPIEYLNTAQINIKGAKSLSIDGFAYVITKSNKIIKMLSGTLQQDFQLKDLPTPDNKIKEPIYLYTTSDLNSIYVLDKAKKRIIEFDKEGIYAKQYVLPENLSKLKEFFVSEKSKKIYILNGSEIYEIGL